MIKNVNVFNKNTEFKTEVFPGRDLIIVDQMQNVQRLLKNNVREVTFQDALDIYQKAY